MAAQETMTSDEVLALLGKTREPATSLGPVKRGDGSRYGKRHVDGEMNQTETEFSLILDGDLRDGKILAWMFEPCKLQLAKKLTYKPDFMIVHLIGGQSFEFVDTKGAGPTSDTSIAKIKMAAKLFPWFRFAIEKKQKKSDGGGWKRTEY